jgi:hypothetical protein
MLEKKNKHLSEMIKQVRHNYLGFDEVGQACYYLEVEKLRQRFKEVGGVCAHCSNDENWDAGSSCVCSVCGKEYYDPKETCLCHAELKPWLPLKEVDSIHVNPIVRRR